MSGNRGTDIEVPLHDLYTLLHATVNYSFGRMTYIVGETDRMVRAYWKYLEPGMRTTLARNLADDVRRYVDNNKLIGMEMDHKVWVALSKWCTENS